MYSQSEFIQTSERAAVADERFLEYCVSLMRDSLKDDEPKREPQLELAFDSKA
jgi:hypothetical protein